MRATTVGVAGRRPLPRRVADQGDPIARRRGELAAGLATAAIAGQLLFGQATLLGAAVLVVVGRLTRWRPPWLAVPAVAGLIWLRSVGWAAATAGFVAGSRRLGGYLLAAAIHPRLLANPGRAAGAASWLPRELPLALLAACVEAALVLWLGWWRRCGQPPSRWQWRPGLVAVTRRWISVAALRAGHTVTSDGCVVGVVETGKLAGFSWAEAAHGVLLTGPEMDLPGLAIACAALRRRKTVLILECASRDAESGSTGGRAAVTGRVRDLARSLGVPVNDVSVKDVSVTGTSVTGTSVTGTSVAGGSVAGTGDTSLTAAIGRAIRRRETVLIETSGPEAARQTAADLAEVLSGLRDLGLRADCLTWINGADFTDGACWADLLALGPLTGTVVAVSAPSSAPAASPAAVATGRTRPGVAIGHEIGIDALLGAADPISRPIILTGCGSGEFTMAVFARAGDESAPASTNCRAVPINLARGR